MGGILISAALAVIPPLIDPKYIYIQVGILIGLVSICLGLLIEQAVRNDEASIELDGRLRAHVDETIDALGQLSPIASASQECREYVNQVINSWMQIDQRDDLAVFSSIRRTKAQELSSFLTDLANGSITVSIDGPFSVRARQFDDVASYRAVSMGPLEFWTTNFGRNYLETQRESIQMNGLVVERIFVLDDNQIAAAEPVVRAQVAAGVQVWVLPRSSVPNIHREHVVDQGVLIFKNGDKLLMQPLAGGYQMRADRERLSINSRDLIAAEFSLSILQRHAIKLEERAPWPL